MADRRIGAQVFVELVIEVPARSSWGPDCTMEQIWRQAAEETSRDIVTTMRVKHPKAVLIGAPKVRAVLAEEK